MGGHGVVGISLTKPAQMATTRLPEQLMCGGLCIFGYFGEWGMYSAHVSRIYTPADSCSQLTVRVVNGVLCVNG